MPNRRSLIIAPLYDGKWLPPLGGRKEFLDRLPNCLKTRGNYDVKILDGLITAPQFREEVSSFFDSPGELLLYFYGHGCLGTANLGYFATSDAKPFAEGVEMNQVNLLAQQSAASEVVLIYDCCHAGAASTISNHTLEVLARDLSGSTGRDLLAACAAHQAGWETTNIDHKKLGAFSAHILEGLEGAAVSKGSTKVRGSALGEYVTRQFQKWNQDPLVQCKETGTRHCVITSGFEEQVTSLEESKNKRNAHIFGSPFKPSQLFVGRSAEIESLVDLLVAGNRPVAVSATVEGLGGIGKTELVLQLLHQPLILATYDAIFWLDGAGPLAPQWEKLAADADITLPRKRPKNFIPELEKGLKKVGHILLVLDNATDWKSVAEWIPTELPLLVTTRTRDFGGHRFVHTELDVLSDDSATHFLTAMIPEIVEDKNLPKLVEELGGHALALELAGWNIKYLGITVSEYLERLKKHTTDSDFAVTATRYGNTVDGCLSLTWDSLRLDASRTLWRRASLFAPTSAHRDLLRVSAGWDEASQYRMKRMFRYIEEYDEYDYPRFQNTRYSADAVIVEPSLFDEAYAELRAFHVLARVEGYNGERWAIHRLTRDFGRARLRKSEVMLHSMAFAEWLQHPSLPVAPEIPHLVVAVLDSAREQQFGQRVLSRELTYRISSNEPDWFDSQYLLEFIKDELKDPKALTLILEGLTDINEDVRIQAIRLLENVGPIPEVFEALESSLNDPDPGVRHRAGTTLAKHGGKQTIEILSEAMGGPNIRTHLTAVDALGLMGKKGHNALKKALSSQDKSVSLKAALVLCEQGQKNGVPILLKTLQTVSDQRQKNRIIAALGEAQDPVSIDSLTKLLREPRFRLRVIEALGKIGGNDSYQLIVDFLYDEQEEVKCAAAQAIDRIGNNEGIVKILEALNQSKMSGFSRFPEIVMDIVKKRRVYGEKRTIEILSEATLGSNTHACLAAVEILGLMGKKGHIGLKKALSSSDKSVRNKASLLLCEQTKIGDNDSYKLIVGFLTDEQDKVRCAAAQAIDRIGNNEGIVKILEALNHPDWKGSNRFSEIVMDIVKTRGIELPLKTNLRLLKNLSWKARRDFVIQLGKEKSSQNFNLLNELSGDWDGDVRCEVAKALGEIGDSRAIRRLKQIQQYDMNKKVKDAAKAAIEKTKPKK